MAAMQHCKPTVFGHRFDALITLDQVVQQQWIRVLFRSRCLSVRSKELLTAIEGSCRALTNFVDSACSARTWGASCLSLTSQILLGICTCRKTRGGGRGGEGEGGGRKGRGRGRESESGEEEEEEEKEVEEEEKEDDEEE